MKCSLKKALQLDGKYKNWIYYIYAKVQRELLRTRIRNVVKWSHLGDKEQESGYSILIGMASKLPSILRANLICIGRHLATPPRQVLIVVDNVEGSLPEGFETSVAKDFPDLRIKFLYYSLKQSLMAERIKLPFVYSWLSWCIGFKEARTKHVLIHDYDALILGEALWKRYERFSHGDSAIQGISWYTVNGFTENDHLATTFEAFVDLFWIRSFPPIMLFNKVGILGDRSVDYDTLLDMQQNYLEKTKRSIVPMSLHDLVHPSQMIHQYTMFRKKPGAQLPSWSIIMIPFFNYLGGDKNALTTAGQAIQNSGENAVNLLGDGVIINFSTLKIDNVDWALKQMVEVLLRLGESPSRALIDYGIVLYNLVHATESEIWKGDFTDEQRTWIHRSFMTV